MQAKGLLSEYQPKYNSARAVYRERKKYVDEIDWNMLAVPPSGSYKAIPFCFCFISIVSFARSTLSCLSFKLAVFVACNSTWRLSVQKCGLLFATYWAVWNCESKCFSYPALFLFIFVIELAYTSGPVEIEGCWLDIEAVMHRLRLFCAMIAEVKTEEWLLFFLYLFLLIIYISSSSL